jgi:uncharacterized coiled-coil protein SlyX
MSQQLEKRIDRFETKMDTNFERITEVLAELARHDERVDDLERRVGNSEDDISDLSKIVVQNEHTAKVANRAFWLIFASAVSFLFYLLRA